MTAAFLPLRALGGAAKVQPIAAPARLSDPAGDAITRALVEARLWRWDDSLSLVRDGSRLKIEVFLPEDQQSDRAIGQTHASKVKAAMSEALVEAGYAVRFADTLFCELRKKGWAVVLRAVELQR